MVRLNLIGYIKKQLRHPQANEDLQCCFRKKIKFYKELGDLIVYLDESVFQHDAIRTHGYSLQGERCYRVCERKEVGRTNVIGAMLRTCLLTCSLFTCNINSDVFHAWLTQDLLPKLPKNSVIVMDNATFHKRKDIQNGIKEAGHTLEYLPPYSTDLNSMSISGLRLNLSEREQMRVFKLFLPKRNFQSFSF